MKSRRVVIICDDLSISAVLKYYFETQDYSVGEYTSSMSGLEECKANPPDIIIILYSSLGSPPDEFTLCRALREILNEKTTPIFLISTFRDKAIESGASEWFDIVFNIEEIGTCAAVHIKKKEERSS
jgi:DNA-binding response OmpR family regulator